MDLKYIKNDLLAGVVVFFVAVPLCLGIAVASGAPPISGLLAGIIGGLVVGFISKSQVSVSGPAAGLVAIVLAGIASAGSLNAFFLAVFLAGIMQFLLGVARSGTIAYFFPSSVIKGMLVAIGIIIIMKQIPHFVGYDKDYEGDMSFFEIGSGNTIDSLVKAFSFLNFSVFLVGIASIVVIIVWDKYKKGFLKVIPGALMGVITGVVLNLIFKAFNLQNLIIQAEHLVQIPKIQNFEDFKSVFVFPDFSAITNKEVWIVAITIALVASIESLLTIEATDKIDPLKRITPTNRELMAQGIGNTVSGLVGGLPITSVIIRSSASVASGGKTKLATIIHGFLLLVGTFALAALLNEIPLTSLAAILLVTGWKLANPKVFKSMFKLNIFQWLPFIVSVVAIVFTDLLIGIGIGMIVSLIIILYNNLRNKHFITREKEEGISHLKIKLPEEVSFLNKASMLLTLDRIKPESKITIDASKCFYIDYDVLEIIKEFALEKSKERNIEVNLKGFKDSYELNINKELLKEEN